MIRTGVVDVGGGGGEGGGWAGESPGLQQMLRVPKRIVKT